MRSSFLVWAFVAIAAIAIVGSRAFRAGGVGGLLLAIFVILIAVSVLRGLMTQATPVLARRRAQTKDVTPPEARLPAPSRGEMAPSVRPPVVVIEPAPPMDVLEQRLETLDRLRTSGLLTDEEYEAKRARVIAEL